MIQITYNFVDFIVLKYLLVVYAYFVISNLSKVVYVCPLGVMHGRVSARLITKKNAIFAKNIKII